MRIIKEGVKPDSNVRFECDKCGTIFEADDTEYSFVPLGTYQHYYQCSCPICSAIVSAPESALRRISGGEITTDKIIEEMSLRG